MNKCVICNKRFAKITIWQKYCSERCRIKRYQQSAKGKLAKRRSDYKYKHTERYKQKLKSARYKEIMRRYKQSLKGKINRRRYDNSRISILKSNPQYMARKRLRGLLYQSLKKYTKEGKTASSSKYGIDYNKIITHLIKTKPNISYNALLNGKEWHIHHIKPLAAFDLTKKEEIRKAFAPKNLKWLKAKENMRIQDFYKGKFARNIKRKAGKRR